MALRRRRRQLTTKTKKKNVGFGLLRRLFLVLGLALADSPRHYLELLGNAARVIGPFLIQYPLYAGIMGVIAVSGLGALVVGCPVSGVGCRVSGVGCPVSILRSSDLRLRTF